MNVLVYGAFPYGTLSHFGKKLLKLAVGGVLANWRGYGIECVNLGRGNPRKHLTFVWAVQCRPRVGL